MIKFLQTARADANIADSVSSFMLLLLFFLLYPSETLSCRIGKLLLIERRFIRRDSRANKYVL